MLELYDYHIHTYLCGHADGTPEEYVEHAIAQGLKGIGFSDHAPLVCYDDPSITMSFEQVPFYHSMIEKLQKDFAGKIDIKIGIEADFIPGFEEKTQEIITGYPYDYVIGSVHFIDKWAFDCPQQRKFWADKDVNEVYCEYYSLLRQASKSGFFSFVGHLDLVKKFGHRATMDLTGEITTTAQTFTENNTVIEINTSGLRKPVKEIYPALDVLTICRQNGVAITLGSDAHSACEVGCDFDKAIDLAREAGYGEYITFAQGAIDKKIAI